MTCVIQTKILPIGQEGDHGCLEAIYQWVAETYGMELTADNKAQIAACIFHDDKGNWFLQSGNEMMKVLETGHKAYSQDEIDFFLLLSAKSQRVVDDGVGKPINRR